MPSHLVSFHVRLAAGRTVITPANEHVIYREHGMDGWILNYTVAGRGRINRGRQQFACGPHELLLFKPEVCHDYGFDERLRHWNHLWVYFFPRPSWHEWLGWPEAAPGILRVALGDAQTRRRVCGLMERIISHTRGALRRRDEFSMNALEEILLWCDTANPRTAQARLDPRVQQAVEHLSARHAEAWSLARLAHVCGVSASRISHLFRAGVRATPMQYLERHRIDQARELLMLTGKSVSDIAYEVGFRDPLYFSRIFRRHTHRSPREFRKTAR